MVMIVVAMILIYIVEVFAMKYGKIIYLFGPSLLMSNEGPKRDIYFIDLA